MCKYDIRALSCQPFHYFDKIVTILFGKHLTRVSTYVFILYFAAFENIESTGFASRECFYFFIFHFIKSIRLQVDT